MKNTENKSGVKFAADDADKTGGGTGKFKITKKSAAKGRIEINPNIVTKDTNVVGELPVDISVIDSGVLCEVEEYEPDDILKSQTIDDSILPKTSFKGLRRGKKITPRTDFNNAERVEADYKKGLSLEQAAKRKEDGFVNAVEYKKGKSYSTIFFSNIFTFFNILIFIVAGALIAAGAQFTELFFLIIVGLNVGIGIFSEIRSKMTIDRLSLITAPVAVVIRSGERVTIPVGDVVLDDILYLENGKQICADCVIIKGETEVNESMLTGESESIKKGVGGELYSGSYVSSGSCFARVIKVGAANYIETLSSYAKRYRKPRSELNLAIKTIMKFATVLIIPITALTLYNNFSTGNDWRTVIKTVSGVVVGMLPAGMFLLTSTALFLSIGRLGKKKTLVQDLYCIEMLARVDVLCLDKTGTITDGSMQVKNIIELKAPKEKEEFDTKNIIGSLLTATQDNNQTAMALANYFGYSKKYTATAVLPFSSKRKFSAASFEGKGTYFLGAPEIVLKDVGVKVEKIVDENAHEGYRVLVLAHCQQEISGDKIPSSRRAVCLIVIEDHIRDDAADTIRWFKENDVQVKVISGDNPITVSEVAKRVGVESAELYISLDGLSDREVIEAANKYTVFGRVSPEQKRLLVKALKTKGHTVAMTGDGVNDILAMREADCSISIASGTEAARNVSHLVLLDSSFTAMPDVVKEGRRVVNNVQKSSSLFLMKTLMVMIFGIFFLFVPHVAKNAAFKYYPLATNFILLLEMCIIGLSSFVLALQGNSDRIKGKFLSNVLGRSIPSGITLAAVLLIIFYYCNYIYPGGTAEQYHTMLVIGLSLCGFMMLVKICEPFEPIRIALVVIVAMLLTVGILAFPPSAFGITKSALSPTDRYFIAALVLGSYFLVSMLMKLLRAIKVLN